MAEVSCGGGLRLPLDSEVTWCRVRLALAILPHARLARFPLIRTAYCMVGAHAMRIGHGPLVWEAFSIALAIMMGASHLRLPDLGCADGVCSALPIVMLASFLCLPFRCGAHGVVLAHAVSLQAAQPGLPLRRSTRRVLEARTVAVRARSVRFPLRGRALRERQARAV